jgi:hypothetical protein
VGLVVEYPTVVNGEWTKRKATLDAGVWSGGDAQTLQMLDQLHLDYGHHADRDLELADMAAKMLSGTVTDTRAKVWKHRMPR